MAAEPHLMAVEIMGRLRECIPGSVGKQQLRTVQRFVKSWRAKTARLLIDGAVAALTIEPPSAVPAGTAEGAHGIIADAGPG